MCPVSAARSLADSMCSREPARTSTDRKDLLEREIPLRVRAAEGRTLEGGISALIRLSTPQCAPQRARSRGVSRSLDCSPSEQVNNQRDYREHNQKMNQAAGNMERQESQRPQDQQNEKRNQEHRDLQGFQEISAGRARRRRLSNPATRARHRNLQLHQPRLRKI